MARSVLVVGIGNELRGDDAAGLEAVRRLRDRELPPAIQVREVEGEALALLDLWGRADAVIVVDTVRSGTAVGTVHRIDVSSQPLPASLRHTSSHTISVAEAIELARSLGELPPTVVVFGIEGFRFEAGASLDAGVRLAAEAVADTVRREALALARDDAGERPDHEAKGGRV